MNQFIIYSRTILKNINHSRSLKFTCFFLEGGGLGRGEERIFVSFADCNYHSFPMDGILGNNVYIPGNISFSYGER